MPDIFDQYAHLRPNGYPQIYVFEEPGNHDFNHMLCVGYTEKKNVEDRIKQEFKNAPVKQWKTLWSEPAMRDDGSSFMDHDVHKVLEAKKFHRLPSHNGGTSEWFYCTLDDVKAAILAVKTRTLNEENRTLNFSMRAEQKAAVEKTQHYFIQEKAAKPGSSPKFLWNAKMRFGKTFASYELAKAMNMKRILVLTFKPAVEDAWQTDLMSHVDFTGWQFYSRATELATGITPDQLDQSRPIVCFGSFQDYLGTNENGGIKAKNEWVHEMNWDLVIFDEYHFGAWRENAKKLFAQEDEDTFEDIDVEEYKKEEADNAINESFLPITSDYYLYLSGTPFRALNSGEFVEDEIFSWTYSDEQHAKEAWNKPEPNQYASLPKMVLMTYKMPREIERVAFNSDTNEFDLNEFFRASHKKGQSYHTSQFIHKDYVQKWLDMIRGSYLPTSIDDLKIGKDQRPVMPYSDQRLLSILTHTLWFMPNVSSCWAMKNLLAERNNTFYQDYHINVCAGSDAGIGLSALAPVQQSMQDPLKSKTITLSCGKLTTGVTIRPWTGIFMLRGLSSPETYFQAAFRVQSPWTMRDDQGNEEVLKQECYVFDFSLNRALKEVSDYSRGLDVKEGNPEKKVEDFINFLPVLIYDGATMKPVDAGEILDITTAGTSATLLARRWESALLVNVDNDTLKRLLDNPKAMEALMNIEGFRALNDDIETIINKSAAVKKMKKSGKPLTPKEKKQMTEDEKEFKSKRKMIQEKLIKFATRIPIFMYLTDFRENSLEDIIEKLEPNLFKRVTGLTVPDFDLLLSLGLFDKSVMNDAVYKFKRYEDASLAYTGIKKHSDTEKIGLFSTVISAEAYEQMAKMQGLSMEPPKFTDGIRISQPKQSVERKPIAPVQPEQKVRTEMPAPKENIAADRSVSYVVAPIRLATASSQNTGDVVDTSWVKIGTKVVHTRFGDGVITDTMVDDKNGLKAKVKFEEGEKTFVVQIVVRNGLLKKA